MQKRKQGPNAVRSLDDIRLRLPEQLKYYGGLAIHESCIADIFLAIDHGGHVRQPDGRSVTVGNDQSSIFLGEKKLIVVIDDVHLLCVCE